jgi:hypothetical protein
VSPTSASPDIRRPAQSIIDREAAPMRDAGNGHDIVPRHGLKSVPQIELWTSKTAYGTE